MPSAAPFLEKVRLSFEAGTFVKLTLSGYTGLKERELRNLYAREVELKEGRRISLVWRHARRDVTKNLTTSEALNLIAGELETAFEQAHLFTRTGDWQWRRGRLKASRPVFTAAPAPEHDRPKERAVPLENAPYLRELGLLNAAGEPRPGAAGKLHQIERFGHLLSHFAPKTARQDTGTRVLDLGAGKGYLTFYLADLLRRRSEPSWSVVGVEARPELVSSGNALAQRLDFAPHLSFVDGSIDTYTPPEPFDWVIALHACNTATDDAIALGLRMGAELIVVSPCCHQELREQITIPSVLDPLLRHGILLEHHAADLTDAIRALVLEIHGYKTSVIEFVSPEHTGKNLMLAAVKRPQAIDAAPLREKLRGLLVFYGIRHQRLLSVTNLANGSNEAS